MELEFMELEFQNTTIGSLKRHYKAPEFFFFSSVCYNSIVQKSSFKLKLNF